MLKIIGILLLAGVIVFYGFSLSAKYSKRIKVLETMVMFIDYTENQIRYLGHSITKIIDDAISSERFNSLSFIKTINVGSLIDINIDNHNSSILSNTDIEHIKSFFSELGSNDIEGEIAHCKLYKELLRNDLEDAKSNYNNKGRLYKSMSFLTAAAFAIIFI